MPASDRTVDVFEASYRFDRSDEEWLQHLLRAVEGARPVDGMDTGAAFLFESLPTGEEFRAWSYTSVDAPEDRVHALRSFHASLSPADVLARYWVKPVLCATLSQLGLPSSPEQRRVGVGDLLGVQVTDSSGVGACLLFALPEQTSLRPAVLKHWDAVAHHLRSALRLRSVLGGDLWSAVEAVIDVNGERVVHAEGPARNGSAREELRRVAVAIDRARARGGRVDASVLLEAWPELIQGRWTIVEHFDSDGRRYYVALRNEAASEPWSKLDRRQQQVAAHVVAGASNKLIADELGMRVSTVNTHLQRILSKTRVGSRSELVALAGEMEPSRITVAGLELLILREGGSMDEKLRKLGLSSAEIEVALGIVRGMSSAEIARARGSSPNTVNNQVRSIFRKLRVSSRAELIALITQRE